MTVCPIDGIPLLTLIALEGGEDEAGDLLDDDQSIDAILPLAAPHSP